MINRVGLFYQSIFINLLAIVLTMFPSLVHAHAISGKSNGFTHVFHGWHYIIALMAVGLWVEQLSGRTSKFKIAVGGVLAGLFALLHGFNHGVDVEISVSGAVVGIGLLITSVVMVFGGVVLGLLLRRGSKLVTMRKLSLIYASGVAIAVMGLTLLICS